jgi:hypothetical protein
MKVIHSLKDNIETDLLKVMEIANNSERPSRLMDSKLKTVTHMLKKEKVKLH